MEGGISPLSPVAKKRPARSGPFNRLRQIVTEETGGLQLRYRLLNILLFFMPRLCFSRLRSLLYRLSGLNIGARTLVMANIELSGIGRIQERLRIGADCVVNGPVFFDLSGSITIGNHVGIGHHVVFVTTDHETKYSEHRCGPEFSRPIVVEDGCWIGAGAMILPGVTIGKGSVVSAGSVVFADVPANKVVGGSPARPLKTLEE